MIEKFIEYTHQIFPSIDTNLTNEIKIFLEQFNTSKPNWYSNELEHLSQGDILDSIVFTQIDEFGKEEIIRTKGIILSNTCDLTRDKHIIIAPMIPFNHDFTKEQQDNIKNNIVSGKMCLTQSELDDYYIDFSRCNSFNRIMIKNLIDAGKIKRVHSLSQFGFYFLCCKITVYFMRVENYDNFNCRSNEMLKINK